MPFAGSIGIEWAWVIPALAASTFAIIVIFGRFLPRQGAYLAILAVLLGFILFWYVLRDMLANGAGSFSINWFNIGSTQLTWGTIVDPLSVTMVGLVTLVALCVQVYSLGYMRGEPRFGWYFAVHSLFTAAMLALVLADNLIFLYIGWELVGICSYLLIGFWYEKRSAAEAAKKAFITTRIGDVGLLIGIILLFKATGSFELSTIFHVAQQGGVSQGTINAAAILIFLGAMGKSAQFPFHVWLPDAMEGPSPVSALIHAATMVAAGVFLVARMFPLFELAPTVTLIVAVIGLITAIFAASMALVMTDLKRVLAYSTISHLGFMMLSLGAFGVGAAIFHLLAHAFAKALLFLGAGSLTRGTGKTEIWDLGGLWRRMPITSLTFAIGALALGGIPPLSGFFSKDEVLLSVLDGRNPIFIVLALVAAFLSALYMARLLFVMLFGRLKEENANAHESPPVMTLPLVLLGFFALILGFMAFLAPGWTEAFDDPGEAFLVRYEAEAFHFNVGLTIGSVFLALGGFALGWAAYRRGLISHSDIARRWSGAYRIIRNKYYIDEAYQWVIDRVVLAFGNLVALFDRIVINDTGVDGTGNSVIDSGMFLRYLQSGRMYNYALGMVLGVVGLVLIWWIVLV